MTTATVGSRTWSFYLKYAPIIDSNFSWSDREFAAGISYQLNSLSSTKERRLALDVSSLEETSGSKTIGLTTVSLGVQAPIF